MKNLTEAYTALGTAEENLEIAVMDNAYFAITQTEMEIAIIKSKIEELSK